MGSQGNQVNDVLLNEAFLKVSNLQFSFIKYIFSNNDKDANFNYFSGIYLTT